MRNDEIGVLKTFTQATKQNRSCTDRCSEIKWSKMIMRWSWKWRVFSKSISNFEQSKWKIFRSGWMTLINLQLLVSFSLGAFSTITLDSDAKSSLLPGIQFNSIFLSDSMIDWLWEWIVRWAECMQWLCMANTFLCGRKAKKSNVESKVAIKNYFIYLLKHSNVRFHLTIADA